jgi:hypothetical protein
MTEILDQQYCRVAYNSEVLSMIIERLDDNDLDELTAREFAEDQLRDDHQLGGYGGRWYFSGSKRMNYNKVLVEFTL